MADSKTADSFGLDEEFIDKIDWHMAIKRVLQDLRSDFIYAPHIAFIYSKAGDELILSVRGDLKSGKFSPGVPLTIEVPKSFRLRVAAPSKRLGPSFSRPGSVLPPKDRLFYQALADQIAPTIDPQINSARSFSHRLAAADSPNMFLPTRVCWDALQSALSMHSQEPAHNYIVKIDVANFFGSLNQHTLINILNDSGVPKSLSSRLETLLVRYTGDRSSRGILQGMYPSDLFGNFYLAPVDQFFADRGVTALRYVDDIYIFVESVDAADRLLREVIPFLRIYDLGLNEAKSVVMPKASLITEEPDLTNLFEKAVAEISEQMKEGNFDVDYGFQSEWDEGEPEDDNEALVLQATRHLFDSLSEYPGHEENIERFCLPLFAKAASDYAVSHVMEAFRKRPSMAQIYAAYLVGFLSDAKVKSFLVDLLGDDSLLDWQKMWTLAALSQVNPGEDAAIKVALDVLKDANRHEALRAVAAVYVGRYGSYPRRMALTAMYSSVSDYIKAAIYFSSKFWPGVEAANAKANWSGHSSLHGLLTAGFTKK